MSTYANPSLDKIDAEWTTATPEQAAAEVARLRSENVRLSKQVARLRSLASLVCGHAGGDGQEAAIAELARAIGYPGY